MTALCRADRLKIVRPSASARLLAERENCSLLAAAVIEARDDLTAEAPFARPSMSALIGELDLGRGASEAAERWKKMKNPGRVLVYGDYDVDGAASTALAMKICRGAARAVRFFIPHRHEQGYGLHKSVMEQLLPMGWDTLIVVDCGSKDYEILDEAAASGMNVFVFDHHQPEEGKPVHWSVVNPHCGGGDEESRSLCATGVLWAWAWKYGIVSERKIMEMADLAALATLADCMHLGDLNKEIVREGIASMKGRPGPGLAKLFYHLGLSVRGISEESLTMRVIPCLNAAGRMDIADTAVDVLLGGRGSEEGAEALVVLNKKRQLLSGRISDEAMEILSGPFNHVALGEDWPVGVLSGVASRICSVNSSPVALAAPVKEGIRGTLRVPEGGDAIKVLDSISSLLDGWGGHQYAAGFSVSRSNWNDVHTHLEEALSSMELEEPEITALAVNPEDIAIDTWKEVTTLGPFGNGNPAPLFFSPRREEDQLLPLGRDGRHLQVDTGGARLLAFNGREAIESAPRPGGWIYRPRLDYWRGQERLQYVMDYVVVDELP